MAKTSEEGKGEIQQDIDVLTASFVKHQQGGFQLTEVASFTFEAGAKLVEAVEGVRGISGPIQLNISGGSEENRTSGSGRTRRWHAR
jgi:hypothetical protein